MDIQIGQEVIVVGIGNNARYDTPIHKAVVSKIGRTWFDVDTGNYIGERERFSLKDGRCDGGGYMPGWQVFLSQEDFEKKTKTPELRNTLINKIHGLDYDQLKSVLNHLNTL